MDDAKTKRFLWGAFLAWIPFLFILPGFFNAFRGISEQKATGLGAIVAGFGISFAILGIVTTLAFEVAAIVLLVRAFSGEQPGRAFLSILSLGCSGLMIVILGLFLWAIRYLPS